MSQQNFQLLLLCIAAAAYWMHFHASEAAQAQVSYKARERMVALTSMPVQARILYWLLAPVLVPAFTSYNFLCGRKPQE